MKLTDYENTAAAIKAACAALTAELTKAHGTALNVSITVKAGPEIPSPDAGPAPLMPVMGGEPYAVEATITLPL